MSKNINDEIEIYYALHQMYLYGMKIRYKKLPHIKEYRKIRKKHGEIIQKMYDYFDESDEMHKELKNKMEEYISHPQCQIYGIGFNLNNKLERNLFVDILIYHNYKNNNLCKYFLNHKKFRSQEKIDFVKAMDLSKLGVYEIISVDIDNAQGELRNVLTNEVITLTDESFFLNGVNDIYYVLRIITVNNINFQTGLMLPFEKEHLRKWVKNHKNKMIQSHELLNLFELNKKEKYKLKIYE